MGNILIRNLLLILFLIAVLQPVPTSAQPKRMPDGAELQLRLKKLTTLGSALYVAAHPDDENTALLAYLSNDRLVRTAYLSLTRGDGGQNLIGTEKGELLGVVRTQELLAARSIDGAEQFFTRAIDFGFSKSPDEAISIWGKDKVLADVVWVIRRFRPDVIITRFPKTGEGGHGHHTASAILAEEAFKIAGDAARFPEQLKYVQPWQPKRLLWNTWRPGGAPVDAAQGASSQSLSADLGSYNALLGKSYTEIAAASRSMHKSQGFGSAERRGTAINRFEHLAGEPSNKDLFDGVDLSWSRVSGGAAVGRLLEEAYRAYQPTNPSAILPLLIEAHAAMRSLPATDPLVALKRSELLNVIRGCAGLWIEAIAAHSSATPGTEVRITTTLVNRSGHPFRLESIGLPYGNAERVVNGELANNKPLATEITVKLPQDADLTQPYWLKNRPEKGTASVNDQALIGAAQNPAALPVTLRISAGKESLEFETATAFRWTDPVMGEQYRPFEIVPTVAVNLDEKAYIFSDNKPKQVRLRLKNNASGSVSGTLRLRLPAGWRAAPEAIQVNLPQRDAEGAFTFTVTPSPAPVVGTLTAEIDIAGSASSTQSHARGLLTLNYPHIPLQTLFPVAEAKLVRLDLRKQDERIGYITGAGDEIPGFLQQIGYNVTLLSDVDLDEGDLQTFDTIITGVRAYNTRDRLKQQQKRLLDYVAAGGTLIVQYNTLEDSLPDNLGPYPLRISRERVTVEEAPVTLLAPADPLLTAPNKITNADFDGWVQERGLYFPNTWDPRYQTLLSTHDPGEKEKKGGMLVARFGKGVYIYTAHAWFRQLPAGVPGAYRLFVNMISAGSAKE